MSDDQSSEVLIIYAFAVLLAQVVNDHMVDQTESNRFGIEDEEAAVKYFGSVQNTMLTPANNKSGVAFHWCKSVHTNDLLWVYQMELVVQLFSSRTIGIQASKPPLPVPNMLKILIE